MTFEQRLTILMRDIHRGGFNNFAGETGNCCSNTSSKRVLTLVLQSIENGDIDTLRANMAALEIQIKALKDIYKLFDSYKGKKEVMTFNVHEKNSRGEIRHIRCCGWKVVEMLQFQNNGILLLSFPNTFTGITIKESAKYWLYWSRLIRDAETRCMKHPRNR